MKVVVVIPTYNERENIVLLLDQLAEAFHQTKNHSISYLVVDDYSPDGTAEVVNAYKNNHSNVAVLSGKKEGLGRAMLRGMTYAVDSMGADIIMQIDADLSHNPVIAPKLLEAIDNGATFAVGSRYIKGGGIPENWGLIRKIYSIVGNTIVRVILGHPTVRDWTGGFRAYTKAFYKEIYREMKPYSGYVFQIAFLHKAIHHGAIVVEVPFHFTDRKYGHSKIAPAEYIFNVYKYIISARFLELAHGRFGKFVVVGGFGFIINAIVLIVLHDIVGMPAATASLIGAAIAVFSNFNFNNMWTFKHQRVSRFWQYMRKLVQFYGTSAFGVFVIQTGTVAIGVHLFGDSLYFLYFLMGTGMLLLWNYTMYSKVIWKRR